MFGFGSSSDKNAFSIAGKVAIVTGALGAIGKGLAIRLVQRGASVMLVDIQHTDTGTKYVQEINDSVGSNQRAAYLQVDLCTKEGIAQMFEETVRQFGCVDILINNAGVASPNTLFGGNETFDNISTILAVNLQAPMEATRLLAKYVQGRHNSSSNNNNNNNGVKKQAKRNSIPATMAVIVNVASMAGLAPTVGAEVYGAAKAGLLHLTKSSASLAPLVRVSAVAPYFVRTPMVLDNPKHKNNKTIVPALMLSVDQVCGAVEKCIVDPQSAGKVHALMGTAASTRVWLFELAWIQVMVLAVWALVLSLIRRAVRS
ncbi:hypothetical protein IWW48_000909 [Coemansia sp. RSA 1200]|nr:hypothetical protein IWW48_000909 [Coemansia sp. RSA 1200]